MDVMVWGNKQLGFDVAPSGFHFGAMPPGATGLREFNVHDVHEDVLVTISKRGDIAPWVSYPNNFLVRKNENRTITLSVQVPPDAPLGNYTGTAQIIIRKV